MAVGAMELPPEGMLLGGVVLAGDPARGIETTEGLSLLFTTKGITVKGDDPATERHFAWSGLDSASCHGEVQRGGGRTATPLELTSAGQTVQFLLPSETVSPGQAAYLDQALPAWLERYRGTDAANPVAEASAGSPTPTGSNGPRLRPLRLTPTPTADAPNRRAAPSAPAAPAGSVRLPPPSPPLPGRRPPMRPPPSWCPRRRRRRRTTSTRSPATCGAGIRSIRSAIRQDPMAIRGRTQRTQEGPSRGPSRGNPGRRRRRWRQDGHHQPTHLDHPHRDPGPHRDRGGGL